MTALPVEALSLAAETCQLLHQGHCAGGFRESGRSILDFGIVVQDVMPQMSRIEINGIEGLEE
jgi:hypothetical protein